MKYDYEQLGDRRFQELAQSLLLAEYPGLQCFPVGMRDGGRDAVYWPMDREDERFVVFQVKYVERPGHLDDAEAWAVKGNVPKSSD